MCHLQACMQRRVPFIALLLDFVRVQTLKFLDLVDFRGEAISVQSVICFSSLQLSWPEEGQDLGSLKV